MGPPAPLERLSLSINQTKDLSKQESSHVSRKRNRLKQEVHHPGVKRLKSRIHQRPGSPEVGCSYMSMKSDRSVSRGGSGTHQDPDSIRPEPSGVSLKSSQSMSTPLVFNNGSSCPEEEVVQQHQEDLDLDSTFQVLQESIVTFVESELKMFHRVLSPNCPKYLERQSEDEEVVDEEEEEQRRRSSEAFLTITLHFLRRMKKETLADCLQSSKRNSVKLRPQSVERGKVTEV